MKEVLAAVAAEHTGLAGGMIEEDMEVVNSLRREEEEAAAAVGECLADRSAEGMTADGKYPVPLNMIRGREGSREEEDNIHCRREPAVRIW